ncbi:MAG: DEAD/DEAH box helicase family protein [Alphaproteobacteria bacterium]|nr:DEAD/DEAH box helicase family protein [Alphaproteobacteria bacterium]
MEIIDNINHLLGDNIKQSIEKGSKLKIAASCFSIYAFEALRDELQKIKSLEFIFTSPTFVPEETVDKIKKEHRTFHIPKAERERSFYGSDFEIQLKNKLTQRAIAKECAEWIKNKARFKSNSGKSPMQQFACIENDKSQSVYLPLHGFTAVDLGYQRGDAVSNIITKHNEPASTKVYLDLFNQIWSDPQKIEDVTSQLCDHIASVYKENPPEQVYFFMLYNIFNEFLEDINEDVLPNDLTGYQDSLIWNKLYNFQQDGTTGIINKLETYNGCILADSVGLGKTFTTLAVVKYYELRNKSVLILCPKKLANNWLNYNRNLKTNIFSKDRFNYDVLCHTDLQRTSGESFGTPLDRINWGNYDLVVIDESHNFRNNDAFKDKETRYQKLMNSVIRDGVKTKVLMLSATPVNNRFNDLRNQLALAYEGEASTLNKKLRTTKGIDEIFRRVQATFNIWAKLPPEERTTEAILKSLDFDFFELLDSVTIARSRKHIQTFYDTTDIGSFPERKKPISYHSPLTNRKDVMGFNDIFRELSLLKLSIYAPVSYILPSRIEKYEELYDTEVFGGKSKLRQVDREKSLQALMTTNLLKRLESSVEAFRITLNKLKGKHERTLSKIETYKKRGEDTGFADNSSYFEDAEPDDDDFLEMEEEVTGGKVQIKLSDMDIPSWEHDLKADVVIVNALLSEMQKITPEDDTKLQHLKNQIDDKIASPINPDNKKVLIFTAFADTANYLYNNLSDSLKTEHNIHTGKITGTSSPKSTLNKNYDFELLLTLFSPRSKEKDIVIPDEQNELDILIATDCISEGQNLQDCDYLINYDIHWNPVRIIQRFGRIDRIGSINTSIQLMNYWPDISLDEYINLKERVESRMVIADMSATADDNPLNAKANDISYRKEQLKRLQEEVIEMEDLKSGVSITDLGLNDFRMDLLSYIKENGDMASIPNGMHAVVPADPDKGLSPSVIFTLRNRNHSININRHNRLHPYYMIYINHDGKIIADHSEIKKLLDLMRSTCKGQNKPLNAVCRLFNQQTDDGRDMSTYSDLLKDSIGSIIDLNEDKDIDSLFSGERTTALIDTIAGLDDFELINFLIVQEDNT